MLHEKWTSLEQQAGLHPTTYFTISKFYWVGTVKLQARCTAYIKHLSLPWGVRFFVHVSSLAQRTYECILLFRTLRQSIRLKKKK